MGSNVAVPPAQVIVNARVIAHVKGSNHPLNVLLAQFVLLPFDVFSEAL